MIEKFVSKFIKWVVLKQIEELHKDPKFVAMFKEEVEKARRDQVTRDAAEMFDAKVHLILEKHEARIKDTTKVVRNVIDKLESAEIGDLSAKKIGGLVSDTSKGIV